MLSLTQVAAVSVKPKEEIVHRPQSGRKKVVRVHIDDNGNELTEEIWEDVNGIVL